MPPMNERPERQLKSVPSDAETSEYYDGYDWRGVVILGLIFAFIFGMFWLYR